MQYIKNNIQSLCHRVHNEYIVRTMPQTVRQRRMYGSIEFTMPYIVRYHRVHDAHRVYGAIEFTVLQIVRCHIVYVVIEYTTNIVSTMPQAVRWHRVDDGIERRCHRVDGSIECTTIIDCSMPQRTSRTQRVMGLEKIKNKYLESRNF